MANQRKIMEFVKSNFTFQNLRIYICLSAGLRIGEVCALTWGDIDAEQGVIYVNKTIQRIYLVDDMEKRTEVIIDTPSRRIPYEKYL